MDNNKTSATKFIDGGAPIFLANIINSQSDIVGAMYISPFEIIILRVFVDSYIELARENRPEEARPCATIINKVPKIPHVEIDKRPTIRRAMWATEA